MEINTKTPKNILTRIFYLKKRQKKLMSGISITTGLVFKTEDNRMMVHLRSSWSTMKLDSFVREQAWAFYIIPTLMFFVFFWMLLIVTKPYRFDVAGGRSVVVEDLGNSTLVLGD